MNKFYFLFITLLFTGSFSSAQEGQQNPPEQVERPEPAQIFATPEENEAENERYNREMKAYEEAQAEAQ